MRWAGGYKNFMIRKIISLTLLLAVVSVPLLGGSAGHASAATATTTAEPTTTSVKTTTKNPYAYTAREGDSYSVLARKAVQTYGILNHVKLSPAQIVAAETFLTSQAGFPELNVGQAVTFNQADVKAAIKQAQALTPAQLAAWQVYVPYVDFDTRDNG